LLAHLNGHLKGDAKAEAFSKSGKTDILIEFENRAAFIAECKVWYGERELLEAISQLFSYTTWRDYKTSLILFNKHNVDFSALREKVPSILRTHSQKKLELPAPAGGEWRFEMSPPGDSGAHVILHSFLFDLYLP
jgi:hypothetical protein